MINKSLVVTILAGAITLASSTFSHAKCNVSCTPRGCDCTFKDLETTIFIDNDGSAQINGKLRHEQIKDLGEGLIELQNKIDKKELK